MSFRSPWDKDYDPRLGLAKENIRQHFNLHRGRWWNYYSRGSWHLAGGHAQAERAKRMKALDNLQTAREEHMKALANFQAAREDFAKALEKRSKDKRDARTYGMHFIDYFPNRETGIAFFWEGESARDAGVKPNCFNEAIKELERSLDQEESSKAKFYENQARRALWTATGGDTTPPEIHAVTPVYTNRLSVKFEVTVTDSQSYVGAVQVGDVNVPVERAARKVTRDVELPIGAGEATRTIPIRAVDLVGNRSQTRVEVVVDRSNPLISVSPRENEIALDGRIPIDFDAVDNMGLKSLQVREDPNAIFPCYGELKCRGTLHAKPRNGTLTIEVLDHANNVTSVRVDNLRAWGMAQPWDWYYHRGATLGPEEPMPWAYAETAWRLQSSPLGLTAAYPASALMAHRGPFMGMMAARFESRGSAPNRSSNSPDFRFDRGEDLLAEGYPVSGDRYVVHGVLVNGDRLTRITVDGQDAHQAATGRYVSFSSPVSIGEVNVGGTKTIRVEASFKNTTIPLRRKLTIQKVEDCITDPDCVYNVMLLPLIERPTEMDPDGVHRDPNRAHREILASIKECTAYGSQGHSYERFSVVNVAASEIARQMKPSGVRKGHSDSYRALKMGRHFEAELAIYGDIREDERGFEIKLYTVDVATGRKLLFPGRDPAKTTNMLAEVYGNKGNYDWWVHSVLASKIKSRFPRLQADLTSSSTGRLAISCGRNDRVFDYMKVRLYHAPPKAAAGNYVCDAQIHGDIRADEAEIDLAVCKSREQIGRGDKAKRCFAVSR